MSASKSFRVETRAWLEANCPPSMRRPYRSEKDLCWGGRDFQFQSEDQRRWLEAMGQRGWTTPAWHPNYGGGGLDKGEVKILREELARIGARPALESFGVSMLGPALLKYGNEVQKRTFLPPIARGEIRWCQGYSEPGSGSDLASLQTRAEDRGDHYLVNGSKIWASYADKADWIFCLVRTDFESPKHHGISFLLFDMASQGVTTSPIKLISGKSPFCQIFFDNVKVPKEQLVGELNAGWSIAKYLLTHERTAIGTGSLGARAAVSVHQKALDALGACEGQLDDPVLRVAIARHEIDNAAFELTMTRIRDEARAGANPGAGSSFLKFYGTELNKDRYDLLMDIAAQGGLDWEGDGTPDGDLPRRWLRTRANSIEGGTSEIQLNIIAKRLLGLPG